MEYLDVLQKGGFNFDNCHRNQVLVENKIVADPKLTKTGTTIVGVVYKDGVCLAADTRATAGYTVAEKNCAKLHYLAPNMYCAGAGTAADCEHVTLKMSAELELMRLNTGRQSRLSTAATRLSWHLFRYGGQIGAHLIIGGFDVKGPQICMLSAYGNYSYLPFAAMGSGSMAAISILEAKYKDNLTKDEAKALVIEAIEAGIFHDLGSGSNVDVCVIEKEKVDYLRNYRVYNKRAVEKSIPYVFPPGDTPVLREINIKVEKPAAKVEDKPKAGMEIEK